jgi:O-succinylbenzoic acid--CoA ligase
VQDAKAVYLLHDDVNIHLAEEALSLAATGFEPPLILRLSKDQAPSTGVGAATTTGLNRRQFDLSATQTIVYTSGTTGRPKGALLTYGNHFWSAVGSALNLGVLPEDRWLICLPMFHVGGLSILHRAVICGFACVLHESFDAGRVNRAIDDDGVTIVSVVAAMLERMLGERGEKPYPPTLRCVLLGGGPAPRSLLDRCAALGVPVVQTYGLTETASQITTLSPEDALRKLGSAGKPLFGSEVQVLRDDGTPAPAGEEGEIVVRGPTVTAGYLNRPEDTKRVLGDGWLRTGDIGYQDPEGYLYVLDRRDDLIVSGGENVYPAEVEAVLQSHPDVLEAGVIGVTDARWGSVPIAVAVLRPGAAIDADALLAFCRERLAAYKVPVRVDFSESLPRNAAGKLLRSELRERLGET